MGLTIHYEFTCNTEKQELDQKLKDLRRGFMNLPVRHVYDIVNVTRCHQEFGYGKYNDDRFHQSELGFTLQYAFESLKRKRSKLHKIIESVGGSINLHKLSNDEYRTYNALSCEIECADNDLKAKILRSGNGYILPVDVGKDCEWFDIQIGRIGNSQKWRGWGFTKTQYAEDFVHCHLAVIKMLDLCREAGILNKVNDEGNFWGTRDLKVLADEINEYTHLIKSFFGALKNAVKEPLTIESKIDKCENYMIVEDEYNSKRPKNRLED